MAESSFLASLLIVLVLGAIFFALLYCLIQLSKRWKIALIERVLRAVQRRRNTKDTFRRDFGYSWDYFMAFRVYDEDEAVSQYQKDYSLQYVLDRLTAGGLEVRLFYSLQRKEVFCKIRCPLERLQKHADVVDFKMPLDTDALRELCQKGREGLWEPLKLPEESPMTSLKPYEHIYAKYEYDAENHRTEEDMLPIYKKWPRITADKLEEEIRMIQSSYTGSVGTTNATISTINLVPLGTLMPSSPTVNPLAKAGETDLEGATAAEASSLEESACFRSVDRMKLMHMIITYNGPGGCGLDIYQLIKDQCVLAYGPLHDMVELRDLESLWLTFLAWPWNQPFDKIKNYFGEKIGLYFLWLGVYTTWLIPASVVGFFIWINIAVEDNNPNAPAIPYFCGFMGMWAALFLENWKRTEKTTALQWGMVGFEEEEQPRPQFHGEKMASPVTGKVEVYYPRSKRAIREAFSQSVITMMVLAVIAVIACIFALRIAMDGFVVAGVDMGSIIASILIAVQIQVLNGIFSDVALRLNNQENHRTDTEYEDALIAKTFLFQFVNSFASLFYISFIKPFIPGIDPCTGTCMGELQTTLATIFLTRLALGNITELGIPMAKSYWEDLSRKNAVKDHNAELAQQRQAVARAGSSPSTGVMPPGLSGLELRDTRTDMSETIAANYVDAEALALQAANEAKLEMSEIEKAFLLEEYHVMLGTFDDYAELVIQFGYTTMFVAGFPLATVMSLVNNYVEIRVDAWKLCHVCRRPEPRSCEDIGTWGDILEVVSYASIFINSALVAFTTDITQNYLWAERVWIFILMASGLFGIRLTVGWLIPDTPVEVEIQLERQEFICRKVCDNVGDDDDDNLGKNNFITPNYRVLATDDDPM